MRHLHEHQQTDSSVSLFQFLVMHYVTDDHNDKDNESDMKLPFKSPDSCISNISFFSIVCQFSSADFQPFEIVADDFFPNNDAFIITGFHAFIWHPPQLS